MAKQIKPDPPGARAPLIRVVVIDVLMLCVCVLTFAFFHHVLPAYKAKSAAAAVPVATAQPEVAVPQDAEPEISAPVEAEPEPTPDLRTEWQIRFEDKFSDEPIWTENSYTSPNVSVNIDTVVEGEGSDRITYYVADIYVASPDCIKTYTANNELEYFSTQDVLEMDTDCGAVCAISGDFYSYQASGFLVRNGTVYMDDYTYCSILVMYNDGSMAVYPNDGYDIDEVLSRGVSQVWNFGPSLLKADGTAETDFSGTNTAVMYVNPRSAIGYYEPGHYCFVIVDGRQDGWSRGMYLSELARLFEDLGCTLAYNLDGGGSAVMTFNHERFSRQSNGAGRELGDIIIVVDPEVA